MADEQQQMETGGPSVAEQEYEAQQAEKRRADAARMAKARAGIRPKARIVRTKDAVSGAKVKTSHPQVAIKVDQRVPAEKIQFFTAHDINKEGRIVNCYPVYYNHREVEDLKEEIRMYETKLALPSGFGAMRATYAEDAQKLERAKKKLYDLEQVRPDFEKQKDAIAKMTRLAGSVIGDVMPSRDDETRGLADAHEVARAWTELCIKVPDEVAQVAIQNGKRVSKDGKMNLVELTQIWQMGREALGETRNAEVLRRR